MALETKIVIFLIDIVFLAIPIALFEITIEKDKGWGAGLPEDRWYGRVVGENNTVMRILASIIGVPYFFGYGILMYLILLPLFLFVEYLFFVPNLILLLTIYIGIVVTEDFSWFVLNWHFSSLKELFKGPHGSIWWHKRWIKLFNGYYLPRSYLAIIVASILLFLS